MNRIFYRLCPLTIFLISILIIPTSVFAQKNLQEGEERLITKKKMPKWVYEHSGDIIIGISGRFASEKEARRDALLDARKQIVDLLGVQLTTVQKEKIVERSENIADNIVNTGTEKEIQTEAISRALISVRAKKYYIEKYVTKRMGQIEYFYKAYVEVYFSKKEHDKIIENALKEYERSYSKIINELNFVQHESFTEIVNKIQILSELCKNARAVVGMRPEFLAKVDRWENEIEQRRTAIFSRLKISPTSISQQPQRNGKLQKPIEFQIFLDDIPVPALALGMKWNGKLVANSETDSAGKAIFNCSLPIFGKIQLEIGIRMEKDNIFPLMSQTLEFYPVVLVGIAEWDARYTTRQNIVQTAISEAWNKHNVPTISSKNLSELRIEGLLRGNYDIIDALNEDCGYIMVGKVFLETSRMSLNNNVYQSRASCTLKIIDAIARREIWSKTADSYYSMYTDPNGAGRKAKINLGARLNALIEEFLAEVGK